MTCPIVTHKFRDARAAGAVIIGCEVGRQGRRQDTITKRFFGENPIHPGLERSFSCVYT